MANLKDGATGASGKINPFLFMSHTKSLPKSKLRDQFIGADDPNKMGTTGLVAWVLHGLPDRTKPRNRWERFLVAKRIVKARGLSVQLFVDAIISTAYYYGINLKRFHRATVALGINRVGLKPEFYPWISHPL